MLRFYGAPMSSACRTHWMLEEVGIPYEYVVVSPQDGSTRKAEYLRLNKTGKVPAIEEGEFVLFESLAINQYLGERHKPELLGQSVQERALVNQWSLWALSNLQPLPLNVLINTMLLPPDERDANSARRASDQAVPLLKMLEEELTGKTWLVGEHFTVADINVASVAVLARACGLLGAFPKVNDWLDRLAVRPGFQRAFGPPS